MDHLQSIIKLAVEHHQELVIVIQDGGHYRFGDVLQRLQGVTYINYQYGFRRHSTVLSRLSRTDHGTGDLMWTDWDDEPVDVLVKPPEWPSRLSDIPENSIINFEGGIVGSKFGRFTVLAVLGMRNRRRMALCVCECGQTTKASIPALRSGNKISCGCQRGLNNAVPIPDGRKIGRLTILGRAARPEGNSRSGFFYRVRCECGAETVLIQERIVRPKVATCGCNLRESIVGQRYGLLTVLAGERHFNRHREHKVLCDCGNQTWARNDALRSGKTSSCGCLRGQPQGQRFSS